MNPGVTRNVSFVSRRSVMRNKSFRARVVVVALDPVRAGTAASQHVKAIHDAFVKRYGHSGAVELVVARGAGSLRGRLWDIVLDQARAVFAAARSEVLYMRWHPLGLPTVLLARACGARVVLEVNGTDEDIFVAHPRFSLFAPMVHAATGLQFRRANMIIAVTPGLGRWVSRTGGNERVEVVTNGASAYLAEVRRIASENPSIVFFGELAPWQGLDTVLKAVYEEDWPEEATLHVVGGGVMEDEVKRMATASSKIIFHGRMPQSDVHVLVAKAWATLSVQSAEVPRNRFGVAPLKVAESLMLGVPPIVSELGGHSDLLSEHDYPWIVAPDSPTRLAKAVGDLVRLHQSGGDSTESLRSLALRYFSWEALGVRVTEIVESLMRSDCAIPDGTCCGDGHDLQ